METNKTIEKGSSLEIKAQALIGAARDYWEEFQKEVGNSAVVWVQAESGHFVLFTRGEYRDSIVAKAHEHNSRGPVMFNPFRKTEDGI